jgi:hypothetical protein
MNYSEDALIELTEVGEDATFAGKSLKAIVGEDITKCDKDVTKAVLEKRITLDIPWTDYEVFKVIPSTFTSPLEALDMFRRYGIDRYLPDIDVDDHVLIIMYEFQARDYMFHQMIGRANYFHVVFYNTTTKETREKTVFMFN